MVSTVDDELHKIDATLQNLQVLLRLAQYSIREHTGGSDANEHLYKNTARHDACILESCVRARIIEKALGLGNTALAEKLREVFKYDSQPAGAESCDGPT